MAAILTLVSVLVPLMGGVREIKAADGYTVPITYSEKGYKVTGLEEPIAGEVDNRTINITVENPDEYTIYDFELTITNANKQIRKVYSSKLYLDEEVNVIKSSYNLVIFKEDRVNVKSKKTIIDKSALKDAIKIKDGCDVTTTNVLVNDGGFDQPATYYNEKRTVYFHNCNIKETINNSFNIYPTPIEVVGYGTNTIKQPVMISKFKYYKSKEVYDITSESIYQPLEGNSGYTPKQFKSEFYKGKITYFDGVHSPFSTVADSNTKKVKIKSIVPKTITYQLSKNSTSGVVKSGKLEPTEEIVFEKLDGQQFRINITGADDLNPDIPDTPGSGTCDTTELDNKIKQLEAQITQLKSDLATKTTDNDKLAKEKADLQEKLDKANKELADIKTKVAGIVDGAGTDTNANLDKLNQQLKDLQTEVEGYKTEIEKLKADNQKLQDKIKELEDKVSELEKKLKQCQDKCTADTAQCAKDKAALEKEVEKIREKIVKVIGGVEADNISDAADALLKKVADLEAKVKDLEAKLAAKEKELQDEKNKNAQLQKQITDLNGKIDEAKKDINKLNKEKKATDEKIKNLNGQIEDLVKETKNLKKQLEDQKTGSTQKIKELEDKIKSKDKEIAKLKEDLANEKDNNKRMSEELARLKGILDKLNKNLSDAQDKFDEYNKIIEDNNKKIKELDEQIADNKQKQEDIKKQISDENAKPNPDQSVIDDLTKKLADTEAEGDKLGKEKEELEKSSKEAKDKIDQLEEDIKSILNGDYEKLKEALEQAKKDFKDLKKSLDKAQKENENLRAELEKEKGITQEKDKKIQDLENEKSNTNDKVKEIQDKMGNLEKELKDKMEELDEINKKLNENEKARKDLEEKLKEELSKPESEQDPEVIKDLKSKLEDNKAERDDLLARKQKLINEINELTKKKEFLEKAIESALNGECSSCTDKPNSGKDDNNSQFNPWSNKDLYDWNKGYYGDSSSKGDKDKSGDLKYVDSKKDDKDNKSQNKDTIKSNTGILPPRTTGQPQLGNRESTGIADYMTVFKFDSHSYQNYINDKYISKVEMYDEVGSIKPFISNDRTMLPIRYVAEALGMEVKWDQATRTATFTNKAGNNALNVGSVTIDAKTLEMRNQYKTLIPVDSKPILINGRFYVSVTNIIKAFGGTHGTVEDGMRNTIEWDKNNSRVLIYKNSR